MPEKEILERINSLSSAYTQMNSQTNRLWSVGAILLFSNIATKFDETGSATLIGVSVSRDLFFIATFMISIIISIAYCSSHINNYRLAKMYLCYVIQSKLSTQPFASSQDGKYHFSYENFAHSLYNSNYNRIYPIEDALTSLFKSFDIKVSKKIFRQYKFLVDVVYSSVPMIATLISIYRYSLIDNSLFITSILFIVFIMFSFLPWIALMSVINEWGRLRFANADSS